MAPQTWSDLPPDVLSMLVKILNTVVDILRLRSVCSSWRSSLPPRRKPSPFPLNVAPLWIRGTRCHRDGCRYLLSFSTFYRLSRPQHGPCAGDPSDGWLLRVSEVNPNRFSLLCPLSPHRVDFSPETVPKCLNLLDYRITEICKSYSLKFTDLSGFTTDLLEPMVDKITVLWKYSLDCDFIVLILFSNGKASYWKIGQSDWTRVDTKRYGIGISDVTVCKGICYAITDKGLLFSFDPNMNLKRAHMSPLPLNLDNTITYLVEYNSDLYVVGRVYEISKSKYDETTGEPINEMPFRCEIFRKGKNNWKPVKSLGDAAFISCQDVSLGFSAEDFRSCAGNRVYVSVPHYVPYSGINHRFIYSDVYDLADGTTCFMKVMEDFTFMYWPPPGWLASSN